ncbi:formate dehydrogenase major subunit [Halodesulfovibrio aestuarii]|nr:formate dehydrogenase major subunit [Halodesulfovibrio aestuarii]
MQRRTFLKTTATAVTVTAFTGLGPAFALDNVVKEAGENKIQWSKQTTSICAFCSVGCGLLVHTNKSTGRVVNVEGNSDHPINCGSLCAKGASSIQMTVNADRPTKCMYRAPYSDAFEVKDWDWCKKRIAKLIKKSRDESFEEKNAAGKVVNRTMGIASLGSAALDNEECYAMHSFMRSLGLVYVEHQARI